MQITSLWDALTRRWLPLLLVVLLGSALGVLAWMTTEQRYNAQTILVVVPPAIPGQPEGGNPLSRVSFDSTELSTLAVTLMTSPAVGQAMAEQGGHLVSVENLLSTTSPSPQRTMRVTLTTESDTSEKAVATAEAAIAATAAEFSDFQAQNLQVGPEYRAGIVEMVPPHATTSDRSSKLRAAGGAALGSIGLGFVAVLAFDIVMAMRERRRLGLDQPRHRQPAQLQ